MGWGGCGETNRVKESRGGDGKRIEAIERMMGGKQGQLVQVGEGQRLVRKRGRSR